MKKKIRRKLASMEVNKEAFKTYIIIILASYIIGKALNLTPLAPVTKAILIGMGVILGAIDFEYELTAFSGFMVGFLLAA